MLTLTRFFSQLQNNSRQNRIITKFPFSKLCLKVALVLKEEGFLKDVEVHSCNGRQYIWIVLKISQSEHIQASIGRDPLLKKIELYSTCSRSVFWRLKDFPADGLYILSTPKGILTHQKALQEQVGGKVLCRIY